MMAMVILKKQNTYSVEHCEFIGYVAESTLGTIVIVVIGVIFSPLLLVLFPFAYIERCIREALYVKRMLEKNPQLRGYYEGNKEEVE